MQTIHRHSFKINQGKQVSNPFGPISSRIQAILLVNDDHLSLYFKPINPALVLSLNVDALVDNVWYPLLSFSNLDSEFLNSGFGQDVLIQSHDYPFYTDNGLLTLQFTVVFEDCPTFACVFLF